MEVLIKDELIENLKRKLKEVGVLKGHEKYIIDAVEETTTLYFKVNTEEVAN